MCVYACVCVCERVGEKGIERERECTRAMHRGLGVYVCVCVCMCKRVHARDAPRIMSMCVYVCVRVCMCMYVCVRVRECTRGLCDGMCAVVYGLYVAQYRWPYTMYRPRIGQVSSLCGAIVQRAENSNT